MSKIKYSVSMRQNPMRPQEAPKAYANLQFTDVIGLNGLAKHIIDHGSVFSKGTITGILTDIVICLRELIVDGNKVQLGDLGAFEPSISSDGADTAEAFTSGNIKRLTVNFRPSDELSHLLDEATFEATISRKAQKAALAAQKKGETTADWTDPEDANGMQGD